MTAEEVDHLHEYGWVKLKRFVDPDLIGRMLEIARDTMGDDADGGPSDADVTEAGGGDNGGAVAYFNVGESAGLTSPVMRPLDLRGREKRAGAAKAQRRRWFGDRCQVLRGLLRSKIASSKPSRRGGNGATAFHQDFITFSVDRSGGMTFWFPLEAVWP